MLLLAVDPAFRRGRGNAVPARRALASCSSSASSAAGESVWDRDFLLGGAILVGLLVAVPAALALAPPAGARTAGPSAPAPPLAIVLAVGIG